MLPFSKGLSGYETLSLQGLPSLLLFNRRMAYNVREGAIEDTFGMQFVTRRSFPNLAARPPLPPIPAGGPHEFAGLPFKGFIACESYIIDSDPSASSLATLILSPAGQLFAATCKSAGVVSNLLGVCNIAQSVLLMHPFPFSTEGRGSMSGLLWSAFLAEANVRAPLSSFKRACPA